MDAFHREQVVAAERQAIEAYLPGRLMDRAASALCAAAIRMLRQYTGGIAGRRVVLVVGSGDNGGDALYAGARLRARGVAVAAVRVGQRVHEAGWQAFLNAGGQEWGDSLWAQPAHLVIDGVVGLSGRAGLSDEVLDAFEALGAATSRRFGTVPLLACDAPSGIELETGATPGGHVVATRTLTFGAMKSGLVLPPAAAAAGQVEMVDLPAWPTMPDAPVRLIEADDMAGLWPRPSGEAHKYSRGVVGLAVGCAAYPGAAVLAVLGAQAAGAGMIRLVTEGEVGQLVLQKAPEVVQGIGRVQAWVFGSGWDKATAKRARIMMRQAARDGLPVVADAGALGALPSSQTKPLTQTWVLTPHAGELAELLLGYGEPVNRERIEAEPARWVRVAAEVTGTTVLLKGPRTLVAAKGKPLGVVASGTPYLATAGSGDVLAGVIGALLAQGLDPWDAAVAGAWVHGAAGVVASGGGRRPFPAGDLGAAIGEVLAAQR